MSDDEMPQEPPAHEHVDAALMLSFGAVFPGREKLAVTEFAEVSCGSTRSSPGRRRSGWSTSTERSARNWGSWMELGLMDE